MVYGFVLMSNYLYLVWQMKACYLQKNVQRDLDVYHTANQKPSYVNAQRSSTTLLRGFIIQALTTGALLHIFGTDLYLMGSLI